MICKELDMMRENEISEVTYENLIKFSEEINNHIKNCKECQPERSKREDHYIGGYFPPSWNPNEHPEKTEGWIAFQEAQRRDPKYYGCGALNSRETD